jgi:hypothetical protein
MIGMSKNSSIVLFAFLAVIVASAPQSLQTAHGFDGWVSGPALKPVEEYLASVKKYPNPPAPNITQFQSAGR